MIKFRTELNVEPYPFSIQFNSKLLFLGSCFANSIGNKFGEHKFQATVNPHGVVFNPVSIAKQIELTLFSQQLPDWSFVETEGLIKNLLYHGQLHAESSDDLNERIQDSNTQLRAAIKSADVVFITLGTAWVFKHIESREIVANCHKQPGQNFSRELLSIDEIKQALNSIENQIQLINPTCNLVYTVSPVRHLRDGLVSNNRGKAHLLAAVHSRTNAENIHYFPAYELLLDDLRDYRFYAEDLAHSSSQAEQYIFDKCKDAFLTDEAKNALLEVQNIKAQLAHRPLSPKSEAAQKFRERLIKQVEDFQSKTGLNVFLEELKMLK